MGEESGVEAVVGRWRLGPGQPLDQDSTIHSAGLIGGDAVDDRLAEVHRLPTGFDPTEVVATLRDASRLSDPGLVTIVDVGSAELDQQPVVYVVTARWHQVLTPGPRGEDELLAMAASLAGGLSTLHRANLVHGALHRGGVRTNGSNWQLGPTGLAPLLATAIAPYRPPGLQVVEPMAPPADLWSLGVVLHEQATGRLLRPGEQPTVGSMPRLTALVTDLLQPNPADRPTADAVVGQLAAGIEATAPVANVPDSSNWAPPVVEGSGPGAGVPLTPGSESTGARRPVVLYGAVVAAIVALGVFAGVALLGGGSDSDDGSDGSSDTKTAADEPENDGTAGDAGSDDTAGDAEQDGTADEPDEGSTTVPDEATEPTVAAGPVGLSQLVVGDCVDVNLTLGDPTSAERAACEDDHLAEVVGLIDHTTADGGYPGRAALLDEANLQCDIAFEDHVGGPSLLTSLFVLSAVPTFGEWDADQRRTTVCLAHSFDNSPINGGLAGRFGTYQLLQGSDAPISKTFGARCFEYEGDLESLDRRQVVTLIACENLHRHEVLTVEALPLEPDELDSELLTPEITSKLIDDALPLCEELWDSFTVVDESNPPTITAIVPGVVDWQLGDRLMTCTASWDEPVIGSVVIQNLPPPGTAEEEDDG